MKSNFASNLGRLAQRETERERERERERGRAGETKIRRQRERERERERERGGSRASNRVAGSRANERKIYRAIREKSQERKFVDVQCDNWNYLYKFIPQD